MNLLFDKIYVINLKRRPDKLANVMGELAKHDVLGAIPTEVIEGVDGQSEINEEFLAANNYKVYDKWTDHWWGRATTKGEIGCAISHYKLWEKISKKEANALILEDDIQLEEDFLNKSIQIAPQVKDLDFELLYLSRKAIFPERERRLTDLLLIPDYSYWTCAYVITPKGAEKLYNSGYEKNLITPDEFIPYMYGHHHESINNLYNTPQNLRAFALIEDIAQPSQDAFSDSETEISEPYKISQTEDVKFFAFATEANSGLKMLHESSLKYGIPLEYAGLNKEWSDGNKARLDYPGGGQKVNILKEVIRDMVDDTIVVFTDGYDVLYNEGSKKIIEKFKTFNTKVLFGAEQTCWPDENLKEQYPDSVLAMESPCKFLNSGVIIGYVGELKRITNEDISDTDDDQLYYTKKYLSGEFSIKLDHNCEIIQNLADFDQLKINKLTSKLENTLFDKVPCIIHGNGGIDIKMSLYKMSTFLINFKNYYGYSPIDEVEYFHTSEEQMPYVVYSINLECPKEEVFDTLDNLLNINYPKSRISLHLNVGADSELLVQHPLLNKLMSFDKFYYTENHKKENILQENAFKEFLGEDFDYLFAIDSDCRINEPYILQHLIKNNKNFVSPLLKSKVCRYSNYWIGERRDFSDDSELNSEYAAIVDGSLKGCFNVMFTNKCFLMKKDILHKIQNFYRKNNEGYPDKINFCANMVNEGLHMHLDNQQNYGYIV